MKNKNLINLSILTFIIFSLFSISCSNNIKETENKETKDSSKISKPQVLESTKYAAIYEVNIRQYTEEGTFEAFQKHIPRLKELGIKILWLMPIYPIGEKNRKGTKGSYYAVQDYIKVNPEFGTEEDLRKLIKVAHKNDMLVILDWVANHTSWDNTWITEHPDWYIADSTGKIIAPVADWTDVADLNYDNKEMQQEMIKALKYWVKEFDIDGYRCDVAGMVPTEFWDEARKELDKIKPVFMLAEAEQPEHHKYAFDANYAWNFHHIMNEISKGNKTAKDLEQYFIKDKEDYGKDVYRMAFTTNHDENSWNGTVFERMPKSYKTFAVLSFIAPSMPLIYSGQEAGLDKRLEFFEKDVIQWKDHELTNLYKKLTSFKKENEALWNGVYGGDMEILETNMPDKIFAFLRTKGENKIIGIFNLSGEEISFKFIDDKLNGDFKDIFSDGKIQLNSEIKINPWGYLVGK